MHLSSRHQRQRLRVLADEGDIPALLKLATDAKRQNDHNALMQWIRALDRQGEPLLFSQGPLKQVTIAQLIDREEISLAPLSLCAPLNAPLCWNEAAMLHLSCQCAAQVLPFFEAHYPFDTRPAEALCAAQTLTLNRVEQNALNETLSEARRAAMEVGIQSMNSAWLAANTVAALGSRTLTNVPFLARKCAITAAKEHKKSQQNAKLETIKWQVKQWKEILFK